MEENRLYQTPTDGYSLCIWVRERLPDLQEGYLDAMTTEAVRAHLSVCFLCLKEYNELEQTVRLVENLPFMEPSKDYAPVILAAIESQSGRSFHTPMVEMEIEAMMRASRPRTTTGHERQNERFSILDIFRKKQGPKHHMELHEPVSPRERAMAGLALASCIFGLALSPIGKMVLGTGGALTQGVYRLADGINHVPLLGIVSSALFGMLHSAGQGAVNVYQSASGSPGALLYISSLTAAGIVWAVTANRRAWQT